MVVVVVVVVVCGKMTEPTTPEVVDTPMEEEVVEVVPALPPISLNIVSIVHNIRVQNGIRHSLYQRYRHYCSRRLLRVRKKLHVKQVFGFVVVVVFLWWCGCVWCVVCVMCVMCGGKFERLFTFFFFLNFFFVVEYSP